MHCELILSPSLIKLYGRTITEIQLNPGPRVALAPASKILAQTNSSGRS